MIWCRHQWREYGRAYSPPVAGSGKNLDPVFVKMIAFGVTAILMECDKCGDQKVIEAIGDHRRKD